MAKIRKEKPVSTGGEQNDKTVEKRYITAKISDLVIDNRNANQGTNLGRELLMKSVSKYGVGRGVLVDKNLKLIGGNHTVKELERQGFTEVVIVPTSGNTLVVTQRIDIDKDSKEGHELAIADNRVNQANLSFDIDVLSDLSTEFDLDLDSMVMDLDDLSSSLQMVDDGPLKKPSNAKATGAGDNMEASEGAGGPTSYSLIVALSDDMRERLDEFKEAREISLDSEAFYLMLKMVTE